jgi:Flp pilus assembly protein TadG
MQPVWAPKAHKVGVVANMKEISKPRFRLASREDGVISVELVILFPVIALIVLSIMEFGHLWYVRQTLISAAREGARAAVVYVDESNDARIAWAKAACNRAVRDYLESPTGANWTSDDWAISEDYPKITYAINPSTGDPVLDSGGNQVLAGGTFTVQLQAKDTLLLLHKMIKPPTIVAQATMKFE